jgi:hypothetical protein
MKFFHQIKCFTRNLLDAMQKGDVELIKDYLAQINKFFEQCKFKETLGFNVQFDQLVNKYHQNIGMKIGEFFDLDKHICRVKFNEFSAGNKLKWSVHSSEVVVGMS